MATSTIKRTERIVYSSRQFVNQSSFTVDVFSGNFTAIFYISSYTSSGKNGQMVVYIKRHNGDLHYYPVPMAETTDLISSVTGSGDTLTVRLTITRSWYVDGYAIAT